jgi:hypothetical protein
MDDWEQPSTSAFAAAAAGSSDIDTIRQLLTNALERIDALERRVAELETAAGRPRTQGLGA